MAGEGKYKYEMANVRVKFRRSFGQIFLFKPTFPN